MITLCLDIITTAAILFIVAAGLLIVFGVMKIVNFAHAAFVTVGAYAALVASRLGLPPVLAPVVAFFVGGLIGAATERVVVRRLYRRPLDAILATWGLGIVIGQLVTLAFGREVQFVPAPISGTLELFGADYSLYRLLLVPIALVIAALFAGLLNGTRLGLSTRAVIMNETLAQGLGIDCSRVRLITFGVGCEVIGRRAGERAGRSCGAAIVVAQAGDAMAREVIRQSRRNLAIAQGTPVFLRHAHPRPQMHFVNRDRRLQ